MTKNRSYQSQLKARVVKQVLSGTKSAAQICRKLDLNGNLLSRWKQQCWSLNARSGASVKDERIAELERLAGASGRGSWRSQKKPRGLRLIKPAKTVGDRDAGS
jgi:transposase-like protein